MPPATCHCLRLPSSLLQLCRYKHSSRVCSTLSPPFLICLRVNQCPSRWRGVGHIRTLLPASHPDWHTENQGSDFNFVEKACLLLSLLKPERIFCLAMCLWGSEVSLGGLGHLRACVCVCSWYLHTLWCLCSERSLWDIRTGNCQRC